MFVLILHVREIFFPPPDLHDTEICEWTGLRKVRSCALNLHKFSAVPLFFSLRWCCWDQGYIPASATHPEMGEVILVGGCSQSCQLLIQPPCQWAVFFLIRNKIYATRWDPAACQSVTHQLALAVLHLLLWSGMFWNRCQRFASCSVALWVAVAALGFFRDYSNSD